MIVKMDAVTVHVYSSLDLANDFGNRGAGHEIFTISLITILFFNACCTLTKRTQFNPSSSMC